MHKPAREPAKTPPLRFLRGDEMVLNCNGTTTNAISLIHSKSDSTPNLRAALAIWHSGVTSRPTIDPNAKDLLSKRLDSMENCSAASRGHHKEKPVMWNIQRVDEPRIFGNRKDGNSTIKGLSSDSDIFQQREQISPLYSHSLVPEEQWQASKELLESSPVFTEDFKRLFAYANVPIMIVQGNRKQPGSSAPWSIYERILITGQADVSIGNGIVCDKEMVNFLNAQPKSDNQHRGLRLASRMMVVAGLKVMAPQWDQLTPKHPEWLKISTEFEAKGKKFMLPASIHADAEDSNKYTLPDILSYMHFFMHSGIYSEQEVRETLPSCSAMYDRFNRALKQAVKDYKDKPLYDPIAVATTKQEAQHSAPGDSATGVTESADPAPAEPAIIEEAPAGITTADFAERIKQLKQEIDSFLKTAQATNPPCNQFHCRLTLSDKAQGACFPIHFTLRNVKGEKCELTLPTGTDNLDQAIAVKKILQSYILNQNSIEPVSLRKYSSGSCCNGYSYIPKQPPSNISLIDHGKYYAASFEFGVTNPVRVIIPLGLPYNPLNRAIVADATSRMKHLEERMTYLRSTEEWETVGEITHYLKSAVRNVSDLNSSSQGWKVAHTISLKEALAELPHASLVGDGDGAVLLSHSPGAAQTIGFKNALLQFDTKCHNPTWRLFYNISFAEADGKTRFFQCTLNLHTADETVAEDRATQALTDFSGTLYLLKKIYPNFTWKSTGETTADVQLVDRQGNLPNSPEPQNLQHLIEDMPQPKTAFRIVTSQEKDPSGNVTLTFKVVRGSKQQNDMEFIKGKNGRLLERSVTIDARKSSSTDALIADIEGSFRTGLDNTYSSRVVDETGVAVRKTRQEFRLATICNLFDRAIEAHIGRSPDSSHETGQRRLEPPRVERIASRGRITQEHAGLY